VLAAVVQQRVPVKGKHANEPFIPGELAVGNGETTYSPLFENTAQRG